MSYTPQCQRLEKGINPGCEALQKEGGIDKRIYVGEVADIATLTIGSDGEITAFALSGGKTLKLFISKKMKQAGRDELVTSEEGPAIWKHSVDLVHYWFTPEELLQIENLCKADDLFCIVEQNNGQLRAYGLAKSQYDSFGLRAESNAGTTGIQLNDDTSDKTTLSGNIKNKPLIYSTQTTLAAMITELDNASLIES